MNKHQIMFNTVDDAYQFLKKMDAPSKLIVHVKLVGEAAELLISKLRELQVNFNKDFVRLGVALHDSGKIIHPKELVAKGSNHETDGEKFLIANGVDPKLARCCRSHSQWRVMECSFEELLIALADILWKGKRNAQLEDMVITRLARKSHKEYWELFLEMDSCFEMIALEGDSRLLRSQVVE